MSSKNALVFAIALAAGLLSPLTRVESFSPQGQTVDYDFAAENDGNSAFLPSSLFDQANCNKTTKASNPGSNGEAIESVLAGIHNSDDAPSGDATFYLTPDAFAKFVGGSVPRSPRDVEVMRCYG